MQLYDLSVSLTDRYREKDRRTVDAGNSVP